MTTRETGLLSPTDVRDLRSHLEHALDGDVRSDPYTLHLFSSDASMYAIEPLAVAFPRHAADIAAAVSVAVQFEAPILPRGAGTSLAGQTVGRAVILDTSRHMNRIDEIDPDSRTARVQPGVVQDDLNRAAAEYGLMFGADTSTSNRATLGGMIGNNSAGTNSGRYGMTIDHVLALDVVLSDASAAHLRPVGEEERVRLAEAPTLAGSIYRGLPEIVQAHRQSILRDYPPYWRHAGGYRLDRLVRDGAPFDLASFLVGSEGTLAVVSEAYLRLIPRPKAQAIVVGQFHSVGAAIAATQDALAHQAAAVELMDRTILDLSRQKTEFAQLAGMLTGDPAALLFVSFLGDTKSEVAAAIDRITADWKQHGHSYATLRAVDERDCAAVLKVRKASLGLLMAAGVGSRRPLAFVEDTAVPPDQLPEYVEEFRTILDRHGMHAGYYGHCSVGCLHIRPFVDLRKPAEIETMRAVAEEVLELVLRYGGVNSSEHGDGLVRSEFNRRIFGDELYEAMRETKRLFDPKGLLNPGKIVDARPMIEHLRDASLAPAAPLPTHRHFAGPEGMRGDADRCMNIGSCRKTDAGVMCPSYMATREEEHSTRGRANALVKALSTPDPRGSLGDRRLFEIMDLCIECKACKTECPLSIDMAAMKSEFLAHYQEVNGIPLRSRAFGSIRRLNRLGAATAPLSNLPGRVGPLRTVLDRRLGITPKRPLPNFARQTLLRWNDHRPKPTGPSPRGEVVFLADSFTTFTEPSVGRAAVELLEWAGWHVRLESRGCCGRSSISKGLLDQAKTMAREMVGYLAPHAERGVPIVGCEPSCLLTLRDEYVDLLADDPRVNTVVANTALLAELITLAIDEGSLRLDASSPVSGCRIALHSHCHEKALTGARATLDMLSRIPGAEVTALDGGCCGMAGSFGFESEHYELSMKIGSDRLFPALAAESAETLVVATGVSCRQQIAHGTGRVARHPIELVHAARLHR